MTETRKIGIWMDHASANLMAFTNGSIDTKTLKSAITHEEEVHTLNRSERIMHSKEQHQESAYYKHLGEVINHYDEVLLFGPTDAKTELFNQLRKDHRFENVKINIRPADKMTENQQHAFVKDYFS